MTMPWKNHEIAPNGKPISENFARWFNDSKLCDPAGNPVVVFRGDKDDITEFDRNKRRETGLFFAIEKERASFYGEPRAYVLKANNPLDLRDTYEQWFKGGLVREIVESLFRDHYEGDVSPHTCEAYTVGDVIDGIENGYLWKMESSGGFHMRAWRDLQSLVEAEGFDALIVPDDGEGVGVGLDYVVFQANQVKSLDRNSGLYLLDSACTVDLHIAPEIALDENATIAVERAKNALSAVRQTTAAFSP